MSVIDKALADSARSLLSCKAAVGTSAQALMSQGPSGPLTSRPDLSQASVQLAHFRGWVYSAVRAIAQKVAGQSIRVGQLKPGVTGIKSLENVRELPNHELLKLLANPNDLMVPWSLMFVTVASLELTGRQLWWMPKRKQIFPIPTSWIRGFEGTSKFTAFNVQPPHSAETIPLDADECVLFSYASPGDPWGAVSPLQACGMAVDADESITSSQAEMFRRGIHPSHALIVGSQPHIEFPPGMRPHLTKEQREEIIAAIRNRYAGTFSHGDPLILDGLIEDVKKLSNTPAEMDFLQSGAFTKERIFQTFGVNPIVCGQIENANRASSSMASKHFVDFTINPKIELLSQTLTGWLRIVYGDESLVVWIERATADDAEMNLKWALALAQYSAITGDEFRARSPLALEPKGFPEPVKPGKTESEQLVDDAMRESQKTMHELSPEHQAERILDFGGDRHLNGRH